MMNDILRNVTFEDWPCRNSQRLMETPEDPVRSFETHWNLWKPIETHRDPWRKMWHIVISWFLKNMMSILPFLIFGDGQRSQNEWYKGSGRGPWRRIDFEQIQRQSSKSCHKHCSQILLCNVPMEIDWPAHEKIKSKWTRNLWNMLQVESKQF